MFRLEVRSGAEDRLCDGEDAGPGQCDRVQGVTLLSFELLLLPISLFERPRSSSVPPLTLCEVSPLAFGRYA